MKIRIPERDHTDFLICTENHGGYRGGYCFVCDKAGWLDRIEHKRDCPVGIADQLEKAAMVAAKEAS